MLTIVNDPLVDCQNLYFYDIKLLQRVITLHVECVEIEDAIINSPTIPQLRQALQSTPTSGRRGANTSRLLASYNYNIPTH